MTGDYRKLTKLYKIIHVYHTTNRGGKYGLERYQYVSINVAVCSVISVS